MALPSSGQLSFSAIYNEQVNGGCYEGGAYSLREFSANAGFSTPDAVSEFYGYSCVTTYSLTLYYNFYSNPSSETLDDWGLYYSIDGGGDELLTNLLNGNTCADGYVVSDIAAGSTVYFGVKSATKIASPVNYDLSTITCPNTYNLTYCGTNNTSPASPYSFTINSNRTFYITIAAAKGFFNIC
jgi:hypothetical protein